MAGSAPEGSQFDARQYDAKMENMCVVRHSDSSKDVICTLAMEIVSGIIDL